MRRLGRYERGAVIGAGGPGRVHEADTHRDRSQGPGVAWGLAPELAGRLVVEVDVMVCFFALP